MYNILKKLFLIILYISGIWLLFRYWNRNKIPIIMYHGITNSDINRWTQVRVSEFQKQIKYISKKYYPISLHNAIANIDNRMIVKKSIVITFDDGFKNNRTEAFPILESYNVPATIFITTSFIEKNAPYCGFIWTDYIYTLLMTTGFDSIDFTDYGLCKFDLSNNEKRIEAQSRICHYFKKCKNDKKEKIIASLTSKLLNNIDNNIYKTLRGLNWDEVRNMDANPLISFGAHTINHVILTNVRHDIMLKEIISSKNIISNQLGHPIRTFAYPNGTKEDFNAVVKNIVATNYDCALTTIEGFNSIHSDLYELKRFPVGNDMNLWQFKLILSGIVHFIKCKIPKSFKL